ncbi:hypothetical protein [Streptomyces sp. G-5]|nr:hypothetical protein [Streptomyces sp. G-5]MCU4750256.1 hypothetical protein [Streptomyces sp. G-5]
MDQHVEFETEAPYVAPALNTLGTVTEATLGTAGADKRDDTQYWD